MKCKAIYLLIFSLFISACSSAIIKPIRDDVKKDVSNITSLRGAVGVTQPVGESDLVVSRSAGKWMGVKVMIVEPIPIPLALKKDFFVNRKFNSILDVAERVTLITGIPINITPGLDVKFTPSAAPVLTASPVVGVVNPPATSQQSVFSANYRGSVAGFMDAVAAKFNVSWEYRDRRIEIFRYLTKSFVINSTPGDVTSSSKIGATGSASAGATSDLSTSVALNMSVWSAMEDSIKTMLSSGGKMVSAPAIGSVIVTDTPRVIAAVEKFIDVENSHLSKQVAVDVQVLSINLTHSDDYGIDWTLVNDNLKTAMGLAYKAESPLTIGASTMTLSALKNGSVINDGTTVAGKTGNWQGSKLMFQALSKQGDVSVMTSATAVTLNNQPVPVTVGKITSYLASSSTTPSTTAGVAPTTTLIPGSVSTGFSMNVLPHIQEDGKLILQYAIDLSSLIGVLDVSSNGSKIQVPNIETRKLMQRVSLRSGETLVLAGFENSEKSANSQGVGSSENVAAGGAVNGVRARNVIVVLVRPVIANKI